MDWVQYYINYKDLRDAGINTKETLEWHYEKYGRSEKRILKPLQYFDCQYYFDQHSSSFLKEGILKYKDILQEWIKKNMKNENVKFYPASNGEWNPDKTVILDKKIENVKIVKEEYNLKVWNSENKALGFYYTWPNIKNAEYEIVERWKVACKRININFILINNDGTIWNTNIHVDEFPEDLFYCIITSHWESPKTTKIITYGLIWNPIAYIHRFQCLKLIGNVDKFITCSSSILDKFYKENFEQPICSTPINHTMTAPILDLTLGESKCFYVGINWEALNNQKGRYHDLFTELDRMEIINIYGPEIFLEQRVWRDYKSYQGEIEFDGQSLIHAIHKSGIGLVLSSNAHSESGLVSCRLFECLAAGVIMIANKNEWIEREFGDDIFYIDTTDQKKAAQEISNIVEYIKENEHVAFAMMERCRIKFLQKFQLHHQIKTFLESEFQQNVTK